MQDAATAAAAAGGQSAEVQQHKLLTYYAQAAAVVESWVCQAAAFTEQLRALARGHGLDHSSCSTAPATHNHTGSGEAAAPDAAAAAAAVVAAPGGNAIAADATGNSNAVIIRPVLAGSSAPVAYLDIPEVAAAVAAAKAHLELLPGLVCSAEHEAEALAEASKAYCLCQALYDEIRPMLGCDYCSDWFHWECVGLQPPREDQDHTEVAPPDFK